MEWGSNTPETSMIALCSKTYLCMKKGVMGETQTKCSSKGLGRHNNFNEDYFYRVLETGVSGKGFNRGFVIKGVGMFTYEQTRFGLSFFYSKRRVLNDGISTEPLRDPITGEFM